eukprot:CAMPEP_0114295370 /NCGR_PEP_ID=MMETSP0059-20121206/10654_1 /TAXON_ID=36894 /ORGANISM="Pyramimonas parkeae, Strain CCMP726" /LENGTH=134 /DNA_ID=CAMNT_0001417271 /DNA_START=289 /DNA_END=693 /DNA_ORIENTATION=-
MQEHDTTIPEQENSERRRLDIASTTAPASLPPDVSMRSSQELARSLQLNPAGPLQEQILVVHSPTANGAVHALPGVVSKVHLCERDRETLGDARRKMRIAQQLQDARDYDDESNGYPLIVANSANLSGSKRRAR